MSICFNRSPNFNNDESDKAVFWFVSVALDTFIVHKNVVVRFTIPSNVTIYLLECVVLLQMLWQRTLQSSKSLCIKHSGTDPLHIINN